MKIRLFILIFLLGTRLMAQVEFKRSACLVQDTSVYPAIEALNEVSTQRYADFDNDGDADLIVYGIKNGTPGFQSRVWFLENQGGFEMILKPDSINLGMEFPPLITDLDQDGDLDVLITKGINNYSSTYFQNVALINQGNFSFIQQSIPALDTIEVVKWKIMDSNGDDYPDILVNGEKNGVLEGHTYIFLNDTLGQFSSPGINLGVMKTLAMAVIDQNQDGFDDIIFSGVDGSLARLNKVFMNQGNNTFTQSTFNTTRTFYNSKIYVHDFDSDGHDDFVISYHDFGAPLTLYINNYPLAGFTFNNTIMPMGSLFYFHHNHIFTDLDSDGIVEIIATMSNNSSLADGGVRKLFKRGSNGVYAENTSINLGDIVPYQEYDTIDIDNNGFIDVYHVSYNVATFKRLETFYNEAGFFTFPRQFRILSEVRICDVTDVNQDGFDDFLAVNPFSSNSSGVYINNAGNGFSRLDIPFFQNDGIRWIESMDIDGDGDMDFVGNIQAGLSINSGLFVLKKNGGTYVDQLYPFTSISSRIFVMNFDGVNQKDLLVIDGNSLSIYVTDAIGNLSQVSVTGTPNSFGGLVVGDHNLDGLDDIYSGSEGDIFINNGNSSFSSKINWATNRTSAGSSFLIDVVGDSLLDVVSGNFGMASSFGILDYNGVVNEFVPDFFYSDSDLPGMECVDVGKRNLDSVFHGVFYNSGAQIKGIGYFFKLPNHDFIASTAFATQLNNSAVKLIDFDGDGDEDFWVRGERGPSLDYYGRFFENVSMCPLIELKDNATICAGTSLTWIDGNTYSSDTSGVFFVATDTNNCYYSTELVLKEITATISQLDSATLEALDLNVSYQWLDCNNGFQPIPGANSRIFTAPAPGSFAVQVTGSNCVDTSVCQTLTLMDVNEVVNQTTRVFPNPTSELVTIALANGFAPHLIHVFNSLGETVMSIHPADNQPIQLNLAHLPAGTYFIVLEGDHWSQQAIILKQ